MTDLRLSAEDATDLEVISSCLQDAVAQVRDFAFLPHARRFALVLNRFRWENEKIGKSVHQRARAGLHFENVLGVKSRNISQDRPDGILNLLAVRFDELNTPPSGIVTLIFSGGGEIRLEVEALDAHLSDLGMVWDTPNLPTHDEQD